jgi:hypothetical protein
MIWNIDQVCMPGFILTITLGNDCEMKIGEAMAEEAPDAVLLTSVLDSSDPNSHGKGENVLRVRMNNYRLISPEVDMASGQSWILKLRKHWGMNYTPGGSGRIEWHTGELRVVVQAEATLTLPRSKMPRQPGRKRK